MNNNQLELLQKMYDSSKFIVFFGGAGVSTESGIPDFRSVDGLYNQEWDYPPEEILSHDFFRKMPHEFYRFYRKKILVDGVKPNAAHLALAEMEAKGKLKAVITQNIDGLHQMAGSKNVLELHGGVASNHCVKCNKHFDLDYIKSTTDVPHCDSCNGIVKPDVVLYGESLDGNTISDAIEYISEADMLIVAGTSLTVYPAAGFVNYFSGKNLVIINKTNTSLSSRANLTINESVGECLSKLKI